MNINSKSRMNIQEYKKLALKKPSKYNNRKTVWKGRKFDSAHEAEIAMLLEADKGVRSIEYQVPVEIIPSIPRVQPKICYRADFKVEMKDGTIKYIDAKGFRTDVYKLKKKLIRYLHNIEILEM